MKYKALLFDMDGVLIDSETFYMEGMFVWMKRFGFNGTLEDIYKVIGTTMEQTYVLVYDMLDGKYPIEKLVEANERYFSEECPLDYSKIIKSNVKETLMKAKSLGYKTALCSSSPYKDIQNAVEGCGIDEYFDFKVTGEQFKESKPNPEIYLHAVDVLGVKVEECVVIEDSMLGIEAGKNAGILTIGICDHKFGLRQYEADALIDDMSELFDVIEIIG